MAKTKEKAPEIDPFLLEMLVCPVTLPCASTDKRLVAMGGRVIYRHRRSNRPRCQGSHTVPACREKPAIEATSPDARASSSGGTV